MGQEKLSVDDIIRLAAKVGSETALEVYQTERQHERQRSFDRRLRNTKLLLRNYRLFVAHKNCAVYEGEPEETAEEVLADLMSPGKDTTVIVESIKRSAARTAVIVKHIETMMSLYRAYCSLSGVPEDERRWRVISGRWLETPGRSIEELAESEHVTPRTIYKDIDIACERIAALMFGVDGLNGAQEGDKK